MDGHQFEQEHFDAMAALTVEDFHAHVGATFPVQDQLEMTLLAVDVSEGGFTAVFSAPTTPELVQAMHPVVHPTAGVIPLFLVPTHPINEGLATYLATFS